MLCCLSLALWVASAVLLWPHHGMLLNWDEVDYVKAARLGAWANAFERGSLSLPQFVRFARAKISGTNPVLPDGYDESRDPLLLRHYHPPLVVLLLSAVSSSRDERVIRSVQLLGALALTLTVVFSYWSISSVGWPGALLVSLLTLWMSQGLFSFVSSHGWEAVWTTATAVFLSRWLEAGKSSAGLLLCASLALAFLTLESGLFVWAAAVMCLVIWRSPSPSPEGTAAFLWRYLAVGTVLTILFAVAVWPGCVVKVSCLKIPALHLYKLWLREEYSIRSSNVSPSELLTSLAPTFALGLLASLWLFLTQRSDLRRWGPFVVIGGLYGVLMARFAIAPRYLLPALAPFVCVVGVAVDRAPRKWGRALFVVVGFLTVAATSPNSPNAVSDRQSRQDLHWLGVALLGREALVDGGHTYQYYLGPSYTVRPVILSHQGEITFREAGHYRAVRRADIDGKILVIRKGWSGGRSAAALLGSCKRVERFTVTVYDCAERTGAAAS